MAASLLSPFEQIQPSEIISSYSEWIYFSLILVFFISVSGIALRKHFDRPYVKPLIISVGLMFTIGAFRFKERLSEIIESWGILGSIMLFLISAAIPFGLARGFGLHAGKAFWLSYILIYILSWVQFPDFYEALGDHNLGLVNLGLLILFIVAIFKLVKFGKFPSLASANFTDTTNPIRPEIEENIQLEDSEDKLVRRNAEKMTKIEIHTIEDIANALTEIQRIIETHRNNLPKEERERISKILHNISKEEHIFTKSIKNLQRLFQRIGSVDAKHFQELKDRLEKTKGKEKKLINEEIAGEEEKLKIERTIFEFERKLTQALNSFNQFMKAAMDTIKSSSYPNDALHPLGEARKVLQNIFGMLKETKALEEKLIELINAEKKILKKEAETS